MKACGLALWGHIVCSLLNSSTWGGSKPRLLSIARSSAARLITAISLSDMVAPLCKSFEFITPNREKENPARCGYISRGRCQPPSLGGCEAGQLGIPWQSQPALVCGETLQSWHGVPVCAGGAPVSCPQRSAILEPMSPLGPSNTSGGVGPPDWLAGAGSKASCPKILMCPPKVWRLVLVLLLHYNLKNG